MHTPDPSVISVLAFQRQERLDRAERHRLVRTLRPASDGGPPPAPHRAARSAGQWFQDLVGRVARPDIAGRNEPARAIGRPA